jgi:hypothetical protein
MHPRVVHCKKAAYDVYVGRPSKWGNPFREGIDGTREEVIAKYRKYVMGNQQLLWDLPELRDKVLGCWCAPKPCHAEVLAELADWSAHYPLGVSFKLGKFMEYGLSENIRRIDDAIDTALKDTNDPDGAMREAMRILKGTANPKMVWERVQAKLA